MNTMDTLARRFGRALGYALGVFALSLCIFAQQVRAGETITFFHNDNAGSPMLATDINANPVWKETYRPYGDRLIDAATSNNNSVWFTGKPYDEQTGLSYFGARYYDPTIGRFMGVDPAQLDFNQLQTINRYSYANNNPYKFVDPDGHSPVDVAFFVYDVGKLGVALWTGTGVAAAAVDVGLSAVGVISPVPGTGQAIKAVRAADRAVDAVKAADKVTGTVRSTRELRGGTFQSSKTNAIEKAGGKCEYCGRDGATQGDHAKTLNTYKNEVNEGRITKSEAKAEANSAGNIVSSCKQCNEVDKHTKNLGTGPGQYTPPNPSERVQEMLNR